MEKEFIFNNGDTVKIRKDFNSENNTFLTQMVFIGLDQEEKQATVSFQTEQERDTMFENYDIIAAEGFANFIRG
jgi:hypothetical protein